MVRHTLRELVESYSTISIPRHGTRMPETRTPDPGHRAPNKSIYKLRMHYTHTQLEPLRMHSTRTLRVSVSGFELHCVCIFRRCCRLCQNIDRFSKKHLRVLFLSLSFVRQNDQRRRYLRGLEPLLNDFSSYSSGWREIFQLFYASMKFTLNFQNARVNFEFLYNFTYLR